MKRPPSSSHSKRKSRRGYSGCQALDPADGGQWTILVDHRMMDRIAKRGSGQAKELAFNVPEVLRSPKAIFQGVRKPAKDEDDDAWLCYAGIPSRAFVGPEGHQVKPFRDEVFLVFVNEDHVAYHWRWEKCDPDNPFLPIGHEHRFAKRIMI